MRYRLRFQPDDNDTILVTSPDFPGLVTYGTNEHEAKANALDAAEALIESLTAHGEPVPIGYSGDVCGPSVVVPR